MANEGLGWDPVVTLTGRGDNSMSIMFNEHVVVHNAELVMQCDPFRWFVMEILEDGSPLDVDGITPIYISHGVRPFGRGPTFPQLGDLLIMLIKHLQVLGGSSKYDVNLLEPHNGKVRLDLTGRLRLFLQCSLFRKYLNYSPLAEHSKKKSYAQLTKC